ncbi:RNA polymerase sigma factor [Maribellus maritimus]|uniref:RNA polymerase sigma factor n=1 Tax=Maribellus maritimus TaxID=2870838 RepID=UPI001EEC6E02|nr:sigma-70 family RNA polymerase sigma factor [Maribellus maritimus]MCG6187645.1 sigma-70 family RNA polymerase sigma factor [Maribellus maritimus]
MSYWARFKEGDKEALGKIFQTYYKELYFYGLKIVSVPEFVKDVIQEVFVRLWENKDNVGHVTKVKSYLLVALRNELIHASKKNRISEEEHINIEPFTLTIEDFLISEEDSRQLNERLVISLNKLSERQREVILLRFYHNLTFEELGEVLKMNVQSVRNLLFRALEKVRNDLKDIGFHDAENIELILFSLFSKKSSN